MLLICSSVPENDEMIIMEKIEDIIKDIEKVLGSKGYARFLQPALPEERRLAYIKDNEIIVINIFEANDKRIQSIKSLYKTALIEERDRVNKEEKRVNKEEKRLKKKGEEMI